jgi:hypothetical protein
MTKASMREAEYQKLKETSWRRPLTVVERVRLREILAAHPAWQESWDEEAALNGLMRRLPSATVSTNFTSRVMQAARQLPVKPSWHRRLDLFPWLSAGWVPRAALGVAMVCSGLLSFHEYEAFHRAQLSHAIVNTGLPPIEWMKNFDTINRLNKVKVADDDLLAVLQ